MRRHIEDVVTKMFVYNDEHNWLGLASVFAPKVKMLHLLEGDETTHIMTPQEIVTAWRPIMEQFKAVHHQIGNFLTTIDGDTATITCYGTSTHYRGEQANNLWTVVGTYIFTLKQIDGEWKITDEIFNCKYQTGV